MNKFVFVVCGGKEHIDELNLSLKFLRHFSKNEIIVVTDLPRNEIKIEHDNIIDVKIPEKFSNHQASIYLKTGLSSFLPKGHNYCYLDGDIVAINNEVDNIFDYYQPPISFAKDHCPICEFSPFAINCECERKNIEREQYFKRGLSKVFGEIDINAPKQRNDSENLLSIFSSLRELKVTNIYKNIRYLLLRYIIPVKEFNLSKYRFNKKNKCWYNPENEIILFDYPYYEKELWDSAGITYDKNNNIWKSRDGVEFSFKAPECNHLTEYLKKEYNVNIPENWNHWNGGVFLFDDSSDYFLNYWHKQTIKEFSNTYTKTRDQGTLALTVWMFGLQDHPNIPKEFNWITEYANKDIEWDNVNGYTQDGFKTIFNPKLLHIYHEWGNVNWSIWKSVITLHKSFYNSSQNKDV